MVWLRKSQCAGANSRKYEGNPDTDKTLHAPRGNGIGLGLSQQDKGLLNPSEPNTNWIIIHERGKVATIE